MQKRVAIWMEHHRSHEQEPEGVMERSERINDLEPGSVELRHESNFWRKILSFLFRLAVSFALLLLVFKSVDLSILTETVASPNILPLVAMVIVSLLFVFLGGLKLWFLFSSFSSINLSVFTGYYFLAGSVGSLAPAIFGDFTLIGLARRNQILAHESISAILMDRCITMVIALFIFTPLTLIFVLPVKPVYILGITMMSVILFGSFLWISVRSAPYVLGRFSLMKRLWEAFSLYFTIEGKKNLYANILISGLRGIVSGLTLIFALMASGLFPPMIPTVCISNSLSVLTHIPVSISGLGVFEGSGLLLFEAIGLNREQVLAGLLYHRIYIIVWALLTSIVLTLLFTVRRHFRKT